MKKYNDHIRLYFFVCTLLILAATVGVSVLLTILVEFFFSEKLMIPTIVWMVVFSIIMGAVMALSFSTLFIAPIERLSRAMKRVAEGDLSVQLDHAGRLGEMRDSYANFNTMVKALSAGEIQQEEFVSNVSHEFKTPINAIEGYAMLLQDTGESPERQREYADKILLNTRRLSELVNNILLLSRVDNQAIVTQRASYRLDEQLRQALLMLERKWSEKELELDVDLDSITYLGSESLMLHVWTNLIDNAIKFTPTGGLIQLRLFQQEGVITVTVADSGAGMTDAEMEKIFDRFYQADGSHQKEGNGLGLALVKRILSVCGGEIRVESAPGRGSRFLVTLPQS